MAGSDGVGDTIRMPHDSNASEHRFNMMIFSIYNFSRLIKNITQVIETDFNVKIKNFINK